MYIQNNEKTLYFWLNNYFLNNPFSSIYSIFTNFFKPHKNLRFGKVLKIRICLGTDFLYFRLGNKQKSQWAKSCEYGGCDNSSDFNSTMFAIETAQVWTRALSLWKSLSPPPNEDVFFFISWLNWSNYDA